MKQIPGLPFLMNDAETRFVGIKNPDGTDVLFASGTLAGQVPLSAPTGAPTSAINATSGNLNGTYYYVVSFVANDGNETDVWAGTPSGVSPVNQQVNLTAIPISNSRNCSARKIYRSKGSEPKDYFYVATINDNTTTTYTDNVTDATVAAASAAPWFNGTYGFISVDGTKILSGVAGQSLSIGPGALSLGQGYACVAIGYQALEDNTSGRRNTAVGVYSFTSNTTGYANTGLGVHSGQSNTTGASNTFVGYGSGFYGVSANENVAVGYQALYGTVSGLGSQNTAVGYRALADINTADRCIGIGFAAGKYANNSRQVFIDNLDRANITNCQDVGLFYGKAETVAANQVMHLNATVRVGPPSLNVSGLPAAATALKGYRAYVNDANATTFASIVAGGGANIVPVYCDGTNWRIG